MTLAFVHVYCDFIDVHKVVAVQSDTETLAFKDPKVASGRSGLRDLSMWMLPAPLLRARKSLRSEGVRQGSKVIC